MRASTAATPIAKRASGLVRPRAREVRERARRRATLRRLPATIAAGSYRSGSGSKSIPNNPSWPGGKRFDGSRGGGGGAGGAWGRGRHARRSRWPDGSAVASTATRATEGAAGGSTGPAGGGIGGALRAGGAAAPTTRRKPFPLGSWRQAPTGCPARCVGIVRGTGTGFPPWGLLDGGGERRHRHLRDCPRVVRGPPRPWPACGALAQGGVLADEVVDEYVEGDRGAVAAQRLRERQAEPARPAHDVALGQVVALHVRRRDQVLPRRPRGRCAS